VTALLAVDVGVRTGLALYGDDGRLRGYRSHNLGSIARLRRAAPAFITEYGATVRRSSWRKAAARSRTCGRGRAGDSAWTTCA